MSGTTATNALGGASMCFSKAGLAAGTTTTSTITNATTYSIKGLMYLKSAASNATSPTTDAETGAAFLPLSANQSCLFVYCLDSAGAIKVVQGKIVSGLDVTGKLSAIPFPTIGTAITPIGYLKAVAGSTLSGTWTFGSSNLSSVTGMTYTFQDVATLPAAPLTA